MRTRRRVAAVAVVAALLIGACSSGGSSDGATDTTAVVRVDGAPFDADDLTPLHLQGGDHPRIADADGRQVLLRGVNLNTLGDYDQANPDLDATFPYDDGDFAEMAALGFDVVRLLVSWSLLEPRPGEIDGSYIDEIRGAVDAAAAQGLYTVVDDGFEHLVFFEPVILWSGLGDAPVPAPFSDDANLVFSPHLYAESITAGDVTIAEGFRHAAEKAVSYGTTFWVGEYGWFGDPGEQSGHVAEYARQEDRHLVGGAWWQWRQACGDPHSVGEGPAYEPPDVLVHLHGTACPSGDDLGLTQPWATTLSRTYPRAAPGRLTRLRNDPGSGAARVRGEVDGDGTLVLWVPDRDLGVPLVSSASGAAGSVTAGAGGLRVEVPVSGEYEVRVTPTDALQVGG